MKRSPTTSGAIAEETYSGIHVDGHGRWFTTGAAEKEFGIPGRRLRDYLNRKHAWPPGITPRVQEKKIVTPGGVRRLRLIDAKTLAALAAPAAADEEWFSAAKGHRRCGIPESTLYAYISGRYPWPP